MMEALVIVYCGIATVVVVLAMTEGCIYLRNERYMYNSL